MLTPSRTIPLALLLMTLPTLALADGEIIKDAAPTPAPQIVGDGVSSPKLEMRLWSGTKLLRNPVALWVNDQGAVYTAESERAGKDNAVLDTRFTGHIPNNVLADINLFHVDERIAQEKEWEEKGYYPKGKFTSTADHIRKIEDTDGNGAADTSRILATFQAHGDGLCAGVIELDGSVYSTCIPNLWKITDDGTLPKKESLSYGWGVRLAFYGHDMHGLVQGPDGRLYFSIGDRGFNVTTKEGVHYDMLGLGKPYDEKMNPKHIQGQCRGGVFRCWPDGTGMELMFEGLRNPQGLAFNDLGQLFTGDNNSDIGGDPARFDHLPEYGDGGWCQDVQTFDKFAPSDGTPYWRAAWLREKMPWPRDGKEVSADPHDATAPVWMIPPLMVLGNGPSGMTHMPGTGHRSEYNDNLLMVNYSPQLYAVQATPLGASYQTQAKLYHEMNRLTDIKWGPDGCLYCSRFGAEWEPGNEGDVYTLRDPAVFADAKEKAAIDEVQKLLKEGMNARKNEELLALLGHRDQRVRQRAQNELAKREGTTAQLLAQASDVKQAQLARVHAIWGLWQKQAYAQAHGQKMAIDLVPLCTDADAIIRVQAARVMGDLRVSAPTVYENLLKDENLQVRYYAALALGLTHEPSAIAPLFAVLKENAGKDAVLRHGVTLALSQIAAGTDGAALFEAADKTNVDERIGLVLALRRLRSPLLEKFITDEHVQVATETARAIYDMDVRANFPALADTLASLKKHPKTEGFWRRAIESAAVLGRAQDAQNLMQVATDENVALPYRMFALECICDWDQVIMRERVWGHVVNRQGHEAALVQEVVAEHLASLLEAAKAHPELNDWMGKILARHLPKMSAQELVAKVVDTNENPAYRLAMLERLANESTSDVPAAAKTFLADVTVPAMRIRARELLASADSVAGAAQWFGVMKSGALEERQAALRGLASLSLPAAQDELRFMWAQFEAGALEPALGLDMVEAAASSSNIELKAKGTAYKQTFFTMGMEGTRKLQPNALFLEGGNSERGQHYFVNTPAGKACSECHNAGDAKNWPSFDAAHEPDGKGGGYPNLGDIGSIHAQDPMYLARALLDPNADIAPSFKRPSAMPEDFAYKLTPLEVRDLLAFLQSRKIQTTTAPTIDQNHLEEKPSAHESNPTLGVFATMFGILAGLLAITSVLTLVLERNKAKLS